ncbi:MAG: Omp28-related outer membrane protein [Gemmatimonadetes bacterium]|nr:Omp28-related outer membrane protein [Gemmatimonadota bacterium]
MGALAMAAFALEAVPEPVTRIVLIEHYTNANCPPCRPVEEVLATVLEEMGFAKVVSVGNHMFWPGTDPFFDANPVELEARRAAFGVQSMPEFWIDGRKFGTPGDYGLLSARLEEALAVAPTFDLAVAGEAIADSFVVSGTVEKLEATPSDEVLLAVIIETAIAYRAQDGVDLVFDDVTRRFAPGPGGEPLSIEIGAEQMFRYAVPIGAGWNANNLDAVVFVQSSDTRIVYQAASTRQ